MKYNTLQIYLALDKSRPVLKVKHAHLIHTVDVGFHLLLSVDLCHVCILTAEHLLCVATWR